MAKPVFIVEIGQTIASVERTLIEETLAYVEGDKRLAAQWLGISFKTIYNRLNAYKWEDARDEQV